MADEVDPLDARPVGDARAREQGVNRSAALVDGRLDRGLLGEVQADGRHARELHRGVVHHDDVGPGSQRQLGSRGAHPGGAADDEHALAVESQGIEERHVWFSGLASVAELARCLPASAP